ncbi:MAG: transcription-repair coupling factor (superfamily II helicase) [Rhodospirillaceae bacterium]|nr:MAG: transcription-repair coupling factor (superfamily II helicase) [Rhodospirillaceae bacterium]
MALPFASALAAIPRKAVKWTIAGLPEGADALVLAELARATGGADILHVARDGQRLERLQDSLRFFSPDREVLVFPAWDCLPYDRMSPHPDIVAERLETLSRLAAQKVPGAPARIILASVGAALQRVPPKSLYTEAATILRKGQTVDVAWLTKFLGENGYGRAETVMEPGEFAVRGGLFDLFPPGTKEPLRLDLFGDTLEAIRSFDPMSQRSTGTRDEVVLLPVSEVLLTPQSIERFRSGYRELFGNVSGENLLYEAVSAGQRHVGVEHWMPLFHDHMETLLDYCPGAIITADHEAAEAFSARYELIADYYDARQKTGAKGGMTGGADYKPLPPDRLYLKPSEWERLLDGRTVAQFSTFDSAPGAVNTIDLGGRRHEGFAQARTAQGVNLFDKVAQHVKAANDAGRRIIVAGYTDGSTSRLQHLLQEHGATTPVLAADFAMVQGLPAGVVAVVIWPLEHGFVLDGLEVIGEEDILGDRLSRPAKKRRPSERFIAEASALSDGDLVVHREHGVGRYEGLVTLEIHHARHDCLRLTYEGGDKLFVPVENIDVLSRYGAGEEGAVLDRLGGVAWQSRKAKLKQRIADMADRLIQIAAERAVRRGETLSPPDGLYEEFCARFPYAETDDQLQAISDVMDDLSSGKPMDRLVCGDVGFGKTEVALRAAFIAAMSGKQVAVIGPTTLLARQHHRTFVERFQGMPLNIGRLSRLVPPKEAKATKAGLKDGTINIICGTHALLAKGIEFKDLGLLIVDEEQHFGVAHKERLKELRADVHVLTLTATPIPRTLQLALTGVRDMSLIATPPVDRLAVRTFITPFDGVTIREALLREQYRGGQTFYVCPRVEDLASVAEEIRELVPEIRLGMAHGKLAPTTIENTMQDFVEGKFDVLLSTNIVESGLDIRNANTMIIHRADMFGLAQLYQLRGRVGRGKTRAYAYLTVPPGKALNEAAAKRLEVMQTLDTLGAGFQLASHDLDIRGAGNLLGDEQSGHIREVGIELYQQLLEEAVAAARGRSQEAEKSEWSPQINLGIPVLIPEEYVSDLTVRMGLYRRLGGLTSQSEIDSFAAELVDRFGRMPVEAEFLLSTVGLKLLCRAAQVEKIDAGEKAVVFSFHDNKFPRPDRLVAWIQKNAPLVKLRPDHRVIVQRVWTDERQRLSGVTSIVSSLSRLAA